MESVTDARIPIPAAQVRAFCERWGILEFALFGSVLREDFGPGSDIDVLVRFEEGRGNRLLDYVAMEGELGKILARPVDIVDRRAIEQSGNWLRRRRILESARTVYAA